MGRIIEEKTLKVYDISKALILLPGSGGLYQPGVLSFRRGSKFYSNYSTGGNKWAPHRASLPGQPPAAVTEGELFSSIWHKLDVDETVRGRVGSDASFIFYLELGTRYMAQRPFLVPALYAGVKS